MALSFLHGHRSPAMARPCRTLKGHPGGCRAQSEGKPSDTGLSMSVDRTLVGAQTDLRLLPSGMHLVPVNPSHRSPPKYCPESIRHPFGERAGGTAGCFPGQAVQL